MKKKELKQDIRALEDHCAFLERRLQIVEEQFSESIDALAHLSAAVAEIQDIILQEIELIPSPSHSEGSGGVN